MMQTSSIILELTFFVVVVVTVHSAYVLVSGVDFSAFASLLVVVVAVVFNATLFALNEDSLSFDHQLQLIPCHRMHFSRIKLAFPCSNKQTHNWQL